MTETVPTVTAKGEGELGRGVVPKGWLFARLLVGSNGSHQCEVSWRNKDKDWAGPEM